MRARLAVLTHEALLLQTLTGLIQAVVAEGTDRYSQLLAEVYAELMRVLLVQQAAAGKGLARPASLIHQASFAIECRVQERLGAVPFDWSRYKDNLSETFKAPAKEILALQAGVEGGAAAGGNTCRRAERTRRTDALSHCCDWFARQ